MVDKIQPYTELARDRVSKLLHEVALDLGLNLL